jgi:hypothetical protein
MIGASINKTTKAKKDSLNKKPEINSTNKQKIETDRQPSLITNIVTSNYIT